jgi:hypothetical protein
MQCFGKKKKKTVGSISSVQNVISGDESVKSDGVSSDTDI